MKKEIFISLDKLKESIIELDNKIKVQDKGLVKSNYIDNLEQANKTLQNELDRYKKKCDSLKMISQKVANMLDTTVEQLVQSINSEKINS